MDGSNMLNETFNSVDHRNFVWHLQRDMDESFAIGFMNYLRYPR